MIFEHRLIPATAAPQHGAAPSQGKALPRWLIAPPAPSKEKQLIWRSIRPGAALRARVPCFSSGRL
ncbi:MAG: hypothetical protein ACSHWZ_06170 [Sulfitobacter sp.]